ncbi:MAG TPA: hypothetical protein VL977_07380 [Solirubrobacteraceae bacterium]|nr:hypothetical protein [Solirubrobacteraceae bacterium]
MIVRISTEGQYRLDDGLRGELDELDEAAKAAADAADEAAFAASYAALLDFVRANGSELGADELEGSDVILPPPDLSLAEAKAEFTGEGLIPD